MNRAKVTTILFLLACLFISACGTSSTGAKTWIDKPRDGSTLPLGPVSIMAHAADSDGVLSIAFYVNGQMMRTVTPTYEEGTDTRFGYAEWEFTPTDPGIYRIEVSAIDAGGNAGSPAISTVTISGEAPAAPPAPDVQIEPPLTEAPPTEAPPTEAPPTQPPPSGEVSVTFYAYPEGVNAGNCSTLHWDVVGTDKVYLNDQSVYYKGEEKRCPCANETHKLRVIKPDGTSADYWATISVSGSCSGPATDPPPTAPPPTDPPPTDPPLIQVDTEGPYIHEVGADPKKIVVKGISCGNLQNTTRVWAVLHDDSGIGMANAHWWIGSESGVKKLDEGWLGWYGDIGPVNTKGTLSFYIYTEDTNGYFRQSGTTSVTVYDGCID